MVALELYDHAESKTAEVNLATLQQCKETVDELNQLMDEVFQESAISLQKS